jgi:hypothetical protein
MTNIRLEMDSYAATLYLPTWQDVSAAVEILAQLGEPFAVVDVGAEWENYNMPKQPDEPQVMVLFTAPLKLSELTPFLKSVCTVLEGENTP